MEIKQFSSYYESDFDVQDDYQLQSFANEVSNNGTVEPDGGKGKVKHLLFLVCSK